MQQNFNEEAGALIVKCVTMRPWVWILYCVMMLIKVLMIKSVFMLGPILKSASRTIKGCRGDGPNPS